MAAMAAEMPARMFAPAGWPRRNPRPTVMTISTIAATRRMRTRRSSSRWSGERRRASVPSVPAIAPSSVEVPVATVSAEPRPPTTLVPAYAIAWRSASAASGTSGSAVACSGTDSPVSTLRSTTRFPPGKTRASAGTTSPAARSSTSPGTTSRAATSDRCPSRRTWARGATASRSSASARSER